MKPARWATERNPDRLTHGPQLARVAEQLGFKLFEWQQQVSDVALELNPAGDYHYRTVGVTVGRQNGKTALAAMRAALELLKPNTVSVVTAQDRNMARLKFTETCELLLDTPLKKRVKKYVRANGQEALYMNNGSSYRIVTPNAQGAR